jgi:hypothetical protein
MRLLNNYFSNSKDYFLKKWRDFLADETIYGEAVTSDVAGK